MDSAARKLRSLDKRAEQLINQGRLDDVMSEASEIGMALLHVGYLPLDRLREGLGEAVREIGHNPHLVETVQIYMDGGRSVHAVIDRIRTNREKLDSLLA